MRTPATPLHAILLASLLAASQAHAALRPEDILKAADEARGNVEGIAWEVTIAATDAQRDTETEVYDIKARGFNVAGTNLAPPKYRGNKILMLNTSMWFYKPGLSKPVPISLRQKLIGDAAYGDIAATNYADNYTATELAEEDVGGEPCHVFDLKAKNDKVTYDSIRYWVSKRRLVGVKADYFTVSGKKIKSAAMDYKNQVSLGGKARPFLSRITLQGELMNGALTYLSVRNPRIEPLPDYVFDLNLFMK